MCLKISSQGFIVFISVINGQSPSIILKVIFSLSCVSIMAMFLLVVGCVRVWVKIDLLQV